MYIHVLVKTRTIITCIQYYHNKNYNYMYMYLDTVLSQENYMGLFMQKKFYGITSMLVFVNALKFATKF